MSKNLNELREGVREDFERWYSKHAKDVAECIITIEDVKAKRRADGKFGNGEDYPGYAYLNGSWEGFKGALGL